MNSFNDNRFCCYKLNIDSDELAKIKQQLLELATFTSADPELELPSDGSSRCNVYPLEDLKNSAENVWSFINQFEGIVLPIIRVCNLKPKKEFLPHIDANVHGLFMNTPVGHIMPATINIVATPNSTSKTKWYRQTKDNQFLTPWASYMGGSPNLEEIDEMVVNAEPVLFRTGQWHSVENISATDNRVVASIFFNYTLAWDNVVSILANQGILLPR
jgi:hypothetical protein